MSAVDQVADFSGIEALFGRLGLNLDPAECHGSLCGMLCATEGVQGAAWVNQILSGSLELPQGEAAPSHNVGDGEGRTLLLILYKDTAAQLEDPEYGFHLLLPDDDDPLRQRVDALSRWCQGFLLGLGLGGVKEQSGLPGDSNEVMRDFAEISRLGHDDGDDKEDNEGAYTEIVEYVRMAALLVYEELRPLREARPAGTPVH